MIINGGARSNWRFFAKHLMRADQNERIGLTEIRGLAADNVRDALREMDALATGTRCKNFFYHANLNPRLGEHLTESQWERAVDLLERNLGLEGHSRFIVEHEKPDGRIHRHIIWSRIDPDSMTARSDSKNFAVHERTARELERLFGHEPVQGVHADRRGAERPARRPAGWETFRGKRSGIDPDAVKATLTAVWQRSDTGSAFRTALKEAGYVLCKGDRRDFVAVDPAGDDHSLARRIQGANAADIRARMAEIDPNGLPTVAEGRLLARTAASSAIATETIDRKTTIPPLPAGFIDGLLRREERFVGDVPIQMQEEWAGRRGDYRLGGRPAARTAPPPACQAPSVQREEAAGCRARLPIEVPRPHGTAQRRTPWDTVWRTYADRAVLFAEAHGRWRTESDRVAELDGMTHRAAHGPAGATAVSRRYTGSWVASIEDGSTAVHDRAAGTAWQDRIRQRAAKSAAAGRRGFVLDASDNKEAISK